MEKYKKIDFNQIEFDYAVLDRFNAICGYELRKRGDNFNIYDLQLKDYVFEDCDLNLLALLEIWTPKAKNFYENEYLSNIPKKWQTEEDILRQKLYLQEIGFIENYIKMRTKDR